MTAGGAFHYRGRSLSRAVDVCVAVWVLGWIGVGVWVGLDLHRLAALGTTMADAGKALTQTAHVIGNLGHLPFVGSTIDREARRIAVTGHSARAGALTVRGDAHELSYLLGVTIAIVPSVPLLVFYLPDRIARARATRALRAALGDPAQRPAVERYLARRALVTLPFGELRRLTSSSGVDVDDEETARLAAAELARLGIVKRRSIGTGA